MSTRHLVTESICGVDDTAIAAALEQLSVPALIASVVQITGDPSIIRGPIRPVQFVQNEFQGMLDEQSKAALRRTALAAICAWRDAGCPPAPPPETAVIRELMDWIACEPVPDDNAALYLEEMDLHGRNPRAIAVHGLDRAACAMRDAVVAALGGEPADTVVIAPHFSTSADAPTGGFAWGPSTWPAVLAGMKPSMT